MAARGTLYAWTLAITLATLCTCCSGFLASYSAVPIFGIRSAACPPLRAAVLTKTGGDGEKEGLNDGEEDRKWPAKETRDKSYFLGKGEVAVRFINAPGRSPSDGKNDIIAAAQPGEILIAVADSVGLSIPRGCMTGLCGTCTCDMEDPAFPGSRSVLRACSTKVTVPEGCEEMVVDVYRMLEHAGKGKPDPMARFNSLDDPNVGFKARWNLPAEGGAKKGCGACGAKNVDRKGMMPATCTLSPGCPFSKF